MLWGVTEATKMTEMTTALDLEEFGSELRTALGVAFEEISRYRAALEDSKVAAAEELIESYEDAGEPLVVFGCHVAPVTKIGSRAGWATITGETPFPVRAEAVRAFQAGELKGIALTIQCAGFGLTLTRARIGLFLSLPWTPADLDQAEDRLMRIGQKNDVQYVYLVCDDPIDRRVAAILTKKRMIATHSVGAASHRVGPVTTASQTANAVASALEAATAVPSASELTTSPAAASAPVPATRTPSNPRRAPKDATEAWAARAIATLAGNDGDHATYRNEIGFNRIDNEFGHSLADQLPKGLTDRQWAAAVKISMRYQRQVGSP